MKNPTITRREKSKQGHRTPPELVEAISIRFGKPTFDLAATRGHQIHTARDYFTPRQDALRQDWARLPGGLHRVVYLNPPFADLRPWVAKLDAECKGLRRWTLCLLPASMSCRWWDEHVLGKCQALGVSRVTFLGSRTPFPKDLALLAYGYGLSGVGFWAWKEALS